MRTPARLAVLATTLTLLAGGAACSKDTGFQPESVDLTCPGQAGGPVTLAIGARANSPAPVLPLPVKGLIREAAKQGHQVSLVRVDGSPTVAFQGTFKTDAANEVARRSELEAFVTQTIARVGQLTARSPEADVLAALNEAARITPDGGTVVLLDSGLQTTGQLRFQDPGMFDADPQEVVDYLAKRQLMPKLSGRSVVLVGLGNTADPQEALDASLRAEVTAIWQRLATASGADCVQVLDTAASRKASATAVAVTVVPLPSVAPFNACGTSVLRDGDTVGFLPDQAVFRNPAAARNTLQTLANLINRGHQKVLLIGTTASAGASEASRIDLSLRRADAVKAVLVEFGVPTDRIATKGVGAKWPGRVNDLAPDGTLIPTAAALNRSVIVQLSC